MPSRRAKAGKGEVVARPQNKLLVERIKQRMEKLKLSAAEVSRSAHLGGTAIHDIITNKNKNPSVPVVQAIAKVLETSLAYLAGDTDHVAPEQEQRGTFPMPITGIAEAGAFRNAAQLEPRGGAEGRPLLDAPRSRSYPKAHHFALQVRGDSMNAAKEGPITEGMYALCVDMEDAGLALETGRMYAIRRTLDGGKTWETTIKRAKVFRDRVELISESSNPVHEKIDVIHSFGPQNENEIKAMGLVYGVMREFA